jgi:hypothetical protein
METTQCKDYKPTCFLEHNSENILRKKSALPPDGFPAIT